MRITWLPLALGLAFNFGFNASAHAGSAAEGLRTAPSAEVKMPTSALTEQFKTSVNHLVREVHAAETPGQKREILLRFNSRLEKGLAQAQSLPSLTEQDKASLAALAGKFHGYASELSGVEGFDRVADRDLVAFADYMQQDMEQAAVNGGIYISGTALIVILVVLLLLFVR